MKNSIKINNKYIGDNNPIYLIADLGLTNGGDIERTFKLIDISSKLKVDAVKFQLIGPEHLLGDKKISYTFPTLSKGRIKQNMFKMFKELEYSNEQIHLSRPLPSTFDSFLPAVSKYQHQLVIYQFVHQSLLNFLQNCFFYLNKVQAIY